MIKVIISSKNPIKFKATLKGFKKLFPLEEFSFESVNVNSGVSNQPLSDIETYKGALNRAQNAMKEYTDSDFWVGLEGGVEESNGEMKSFSYVVILHGFLISKAKTAEYILPTKIAELIKQGKELGEADDIVFGRTNSKQKNGAVGLLTNNIITREDLFETAVVLALIPFVNKKLYSI